MNGLEPVADEVVAAWQYSVVDCGEERDPRNDEPELTIREA